MMMLPYPSEPQGQGPTGMVIEALPMWQEAGELGDHRQYIFHYHTIMCPQFANGYCPRHKGSRSAPPQCFCYHFESQRRRPLVDALTGQLRYWDVLCEHVAEGHDCPCGDLCPFAHTREEISYHAAKYKTKFCNDRDCRGQEVCCFAHGESELRTHALERYSYWSIFGSGPGGPPGGPRLSNSGNDLALVTSLGPGMAGGRNATGALYHPKVYKHRFCASYPHVASCRRGDACAFAHSREEIRTPLLAGEEEDQRASALTNDFFMYRFKTLWCPVGVQHDWQTCVYAHNYQDARRHPGIGYGPRPCPYWKRKETALEYSQRCPLGVRCPFSHGAKEQLYHPAYFKTVTCQDWPNSNCPRGKLCAFWHKRSQQRARPSSEDEFDYKLPIPENRLEDALQVDFLSPPFKLLNSLQAEVSQAEGCQSQGELGLAGEMCGAAGGAVLAETPCQPPLSAWAPSFCGFNSGGAPTTPTTIADSDEAASADSSSGSDKTPAVQDDDSSAGGALQLNGSADAGLLGEAGFPWTAGSWISEGMTMPGFGPPLGDCNAQPQMMCYVQVQHLGGSQQVLQQPAVFCSGSGNPADPCGSTLGLPQLPEDALALSGDYAPQGHFTQPLGAEAVVAPPMSLWWGGPAISGAGGAYGFNMVDCGDGMFCGSTGVPMLVAGMRFAEAGSTEMLELPGAVAGDAGTTGKGGVAWEHEETIPTYNGFIHFKDAEGPDPESAPAPRRPRANSH